MLGALTLSVILSIFAVAGYRVYERDLPAKSAAHRIAHTYSMARSMAIARNGTFTVKFDRKQDNWWIDETTAAGDLLFARVDSTEKLGEKVRITNIQFGLPQEDGEDIFIDNPVVGDQVAVRFFPDGSSDQVSVYLKPVERLDENNPADTYTVRLYGPTGQSRVFPGEERAPTSFQP